jgi:hypothetical protein
MADEVVQIPIQLFHRMCKALIEVEKILKEKAEKEEEVWISAERAMEILGCKRAKLFQLKASGEIKYKAIGRMHQYNKKSIEKYISLMST